MGAGPRQSEDPAAAAWKEKPSTTVSGPTFAPDPARAAESEPGHRLASPPSTAQLQRLFALSPDLLCVAGTDGFFKSLNPAWERLLGWTTQELTSKRYLDFVHPDDHNATLWAADRLKQGYDVVSFKNRYRTRRGTYKWISWTSSVDADEGTIYAVARDETDRVRLENELKERESFLDSIVENVPAMIFVKDADDLRFVRFNRAGEELLGAPREEMIGKTDYDFFPRTQADFFTSNDRRVLQSGKLVDIPEEPIRTRSKGQRILHTQKIPILDAGGSPRFLLGISEDVTERRHAQAELHSAYARLKEVEATRIQIVNNLAHDLMTPLTPIKIQLHLLSANPPVADSVRHAAIEMVVRNVAHMERLIGDLKDYARIESGHLTLRRASHDLGRMIESYVDTFRKLAEERRIRLEASAAAGLNAEVDMDRITQVLYNLLSNALKFTPAGGRVQVEGTRGDAGVFVSVADTGSGLSPEEIGRLFQPFEQVHDRTAVKERGTGLGLFISKGIVEAHGGKIWAESPGPGKGARFMVSIPAP